MGCEIRSSAGLERVPAEVSFAGLAPGWIGIGQLDIRLRGRLPRESWARVVCRLSAWVGFETGALPHGGVLILQW